MVNGNMTIVEAPYYEDYASLKKWLRKRDGVFKSMSLSRFMYSQAGTGGFVDISEKGGETIVNIGAEGALYGAMEVDNAATRDIEIELEYLDDGGLIHTAYLQTDAADSSAEEQFMTTSGGVTPIADFYRVRDLCAPLNLIGGNFIIGPTGLAAVYGVIEVGNHCSIHSQYICPTGYSAWLANVNFSSSVATKVVTQLDITFVPYGETDSHVAIINNDGLVQIDPLFRLAANYAITFRVKGNLTENTFNIHIIEIEDV